MQVTTTFRHTQSQPVRHHALKRLSRVRKPLSCELALPFAPTAPPCQALKQQMFVGPSLEVDAAVMQVSLRDTVSLAFPDVDAGLISIVYRRKDGHYGLINTGAQVSAKSTEKS